MNPRPLIIVGVIIVIIAILGAVGYKLNDEYNSPRSPIIPATSEDVEAPPTGADIETGELPPQASTTEPSVIKYPLPTPTSATMTKDWNTYTGAGFSIRYPTDVLKSGDNGAKTVTFTFPSDSYFHWPLLDDATVTVTASTTCGAIDDEGPLMDTQTFELNDLDFTRTVTLGAAAGNRYLRLFYDTKLGTDKAPRMCYRVAFMDHGANGAGLYVDSASLIQKYDELHDQDLGVVIDMLNGMVGSLRIK